MLVLPKSSMSLRSSAKVLGSSSLLTVLDKVIRRRRSQDLLYTIIILRLNPARRIVGATLKTTSSTTLYT